MTAISFHSVKGGSGCTTVACLFALQLARSNNPVHLSSRHSMVQLDDAADILGVRFEPETAKSAPPLVTVLPGFTLGDRTLDDDDTILVEDIGYQASIHYSARRVPGVARVLVIRNDYMSLRRAVRQDLGHLTRLDGVVLIEHPGWPLHASDVAAVLPLPLLETWTVDPHFQGKLDAGILTSSRHPHFFHHLDRLVGVRA